MIFVVRIYIVFCCRGISVLRRSCVELLRSGWSVRRGLMFMLMSR